MKIEKAILCRDAVCRGPGQKKYYEHRILKGEEAIKISDFRLNGNMCTFFICKFHASILVEELSSLIKNVLPP